MRPARPDRRNGEMITIMVSAIISAITAKIVATYYFKKADSYVSILDQPDQSERRKRLDICK